MPFFPQILSANLSCLVIGGHAVISYGVPRSTFDVDFLVRGVDRELWREFMLKLGYSVFHETQPFIQWTAPPDEVAVDFMFVDERTWEKMWRAARSISIGGLEYHAVCPLHLIALKLHAMKYRQGILGQKDWGDVLGLIQSCHIDPTAPDLLQIVGRYGSAETRSSYYAHFKLDEPSH